MMGIPFTQYILPDGRQNMVFFDHTPEVEAIASSIIAAGNRFECEILRTGDVSLTVTNDDDGDLDIEVVPNGPGIAEAVEALIRRVASVQP